MNGGNANEKNVFYPHRDKSLSWAGVFEKRDGLATGKGADNEYDKEAIKVMMKGLDKIGYVANSPYTMLGDSLSAGRLYDNIGKKAEGKVLYVVNEGVLCCVTKKRLK